MKVEYPLPKQSELNRFTLKEWAKKIGKPYSSLYAYIHTKGWKTSDYFKRPPSPLKIEYPLPQGNEVGKYPRREWARLKGIKVVNYLVWLDYRPELKKLFKNRPTVVYELPKGKQIKTMTAGRWARAKGYDPTSLVAWMKVRGLKVSDYFIDGSTARTKVILPKGKDLKRFTVPEWTKKLNIHEKSIYAYLRIRGLKVEDYFKRMRRRRN